MCGIVGGITERSITPLLIEGLQRLEYRGYDSAGVAVMQQAGAIQRLRNLGKVAGLQARVEGEQLDGHTGIAHTRTNVFVVGGIDPTLDALHWAVMFSHRLFPLSGYFATSRG